MPRKPIHREPMTPAERSRRYRQQRLRRQSLAMREPATAPTVSLLDELRACMELGNVDAVKAIARELVNRVERDASRNRAE